MDKWRKLVLVVVLGAMLVAPWAMANLAAPANVADQRATQVAFGLVTPDGACPFGQILTNRGGLSVCVPWDVPVTNVNWNS